MEHHFVELVTERLLLLLWMLRISDASICRYDCRYGEQLTSRPALIEDAAPIKVHDPRCRTQDWVTVLPTSVCNKEYPSRKRDTGTVCAYTPHVRSIKRPFLAILFTPVRASTCRLLPLLFSLEIHSQFVSFLHISSTSAWHMKGNLYTLGSTCQRNN